MSKRQSNAPRRSWQVHRYDNSIAVYVGGPLRYMAPAEAADFARALLRAVDDCRTYSPASSRFATATGTIEKELTE